MVIDGHDVLSKNPFQGVYPLEALRRRTREQHTEGEPWVAHEPLIPEATTVA